MTEDRCYSALHLRLYRVATRPIRKLIGFQKHHRIPSSTTDGLAFLHTLAKSEIDSDFETTFAALRNGYGFKRREIIVAPTEAGVGTIETPYFTYEFTISFVPHDPGQVSLSRSIKDIRSLEQVINPIFAEVFGSQFNSLEMVFAEPFQIESIIDFVEGLDANQPTIDYDRDLSWCEIQFNSGTPAVRIQGNRLQITNSLRTIQPIDLLRSLAEVQHCLQQWFRFDSTQLAKLSV